MANFVSRVGLVSAFTLVSRVLGLARDMMTSAMLGASVWNSAFITAFTLPNLFRRLLGEGALTAALMPNLSEELETRGRVAVHDLVNKTLTWLTLICLALIVLALAGLELFKRSDAAGKWEVAAGLGQILFPYILLICIAAILSAALNLFARFGIPALTAVWLNVSILLALGYAGWSLGEDLRGKTYWLCGGALLGGVLQMLVPAFALAREGWRPRFDLRVSPRLREVALLTIPGVFGAAVFQINIMVSRGLAFYVSDSAAALLYYANRLVELPVGVFAIAISTVVFPALSHAIAGKRLDTFAQTYKRGILLCTLMAVPSAMGLILLAPQIIDLLFERGMFTAEDTASTVPLVIAFALGMPFYSFLSVETRAFFALKDTKTPVRAAVVAFVVNIALSILLMKPFGALGLAVASNVAAVVQAVTLHLALARKNLDTDLRPLAGDAGRILIATGVMAGVVLAGIRWIDARVEGELLSVALPVAALIPLAAGVYFLSLRFLGLGWRRMLR